MMVKRLKEDTEYQKFFQMAMKKFNINTPAELKDPTKKKEFFDYVDKNYKAKDEMNEDAGTILMRSHPGMVEEIIEMLKLLLNCVKTLILMVKQWNTF